MTVLPVILAPTKVHWTVQIGLYISIGGFLVVLFTCVGMHEHTNPASFLVNIGSGESGWNQRVAWLLGISNAMYAFGGTDGGMFPVPQETYLFCANA